MNWPPRKKLQNAVCFRRPRRRPQTTAETRLGGGSFAATSNADNAKLRLHVTEETQINANKGTPNEDSRDQ